MGENDRSGQVNCEERWGDHEKIARRTFDGVAARKHNIDSCFGRVLSWYQMRPSFLQTAPPTHKFGTSITSMLRLMSSCRTTSSPTSGEKVEFSLPKTKDPSKAPSLFSRNKHCVEHISLKKRQRCILNITSLWNDACHTQSSSHPHNLALSQNTRTDRCVHSLPGTPALLPSCPLQSQSWPWYYPSLPSSNAHEAHPSERPIVVRWGRSVPAMRLFPLL